VIDLGPHASYIIWSYVGTGIVIAGMIVKIVVDAHQQDSKLKDLEAAGITRRSSGGTS